jgi:hypothetical protein
LLFVFLMVGACGGGSEGGGSPTTPAPTQTQSRAIRLEATLEFGDVMIGASNDRTLRIYNEGNSPLTVTSVSGPGADAYTSTWTDGTIAPGTSQTATIRFRPLEARTYNGTVTVNANHTSGINTTSISGRGVAPPPAPSQPRRQRRPQPRRPRLRLRRHQLPVRRQRRSLIAVGSAQLEKRVATRASIGISRAMSVPDVPATRSLVAQSRRRTTALFQRHRG